MLECTNHLRERGFTLIELMITIAVIAILVALAVPAYKDYAVRAKVGECINNASVPKIHVSEYRQVLGAWPPSASDAAIDSPQGDSRYCNGATNYQNSTGAFYMDVDEASVGVTSGVVEPILTPTELSSGNIDWDCGPGETTAANLRFLPATCKDS